MIYPDWLKEGDYIGVCAPSNGVKDELKANRFQNGRDNLKQNGINVKFSEHVFTADERGVSAPGDIRAKEYMELVEDNSVKLIHSAAGGDFLMEMLEYLDYEKIKQNPTWFQGYSDNTNLTYSITTLCDIATIYGFNFSDFGMKQWEKSVSRGFDILKGKEVIQESFEYFENDWHDDESGLAGYFKDEKVAWVNARDEKEIEVTGRMLGGCLDVIAHISGTKYDGTLEYTEKYKEDGILWFLESFDLTAEELILTLWRLKEMGYFKYAKGFVFGRPCMFSSGCDLSYKDAVLSILGDLEVPIILDADIGHRGPQFSVINGAIGTIKSKNGKGSYAFDLR